MSTEYRFDEPALNIAQKIMECRATAAAEDWPDVRLKAAIQCLVIEAMKWAAPPADEKYLNRIDEAIASYETVGDAISLLEDYRARLTGAPAPGGEHG